jgi:hypothetical protein
MKYMFALQARAEAEAEAKAATGAAELSVMFGFSVNGATGVGGCLVNGFYKKIAEVVNGMPVFINLDSGGTICCWFGEDSHWHLSQIKNKNTNMCGGYAHSARLHLPHPALPEERGNVANDGTYVAQPEVTVQVASATEVVCALMFLPRSSHLAPSGPHLARLMLRFLLPLNNQSTQVKGVK